MTVPIPFQNYIESVISLGVGVTSAKDFKIRLGDLEATSPFSMRANWSELKKISENTIQPVADSSTEDLIGSGNEQENQSSCEL